MSLGLKRTALRVGLLAGGILTALLGVGATLGLMVDGVPNLAGGVVTLIRLPILFATAWGCFTAFRRYGDPKVALPDLTALGRLRDVYVARGLARASSAEIADNPYAGLTDAALLDVCMNLNPRFGQERVVALLSTVKRRVEVCFLPDGRLIPESIRALAPQPAPAGSACATHPEAPAKLACLRCGGFACEACASADRRHCRRCLDVLIPV